MKVKTKNTGSKLNKLNQTKEHGMNPSILKPENLQIQVIRAYKHTMDDSYENGCDIDSSKERDVECEKTYKTIEEAFRDIVGDKTIKPDEIRGFDPNIYRDNLKGGAMVVDDRTERGHFRCCYDRMENSRGRKPNETEMADFESGKIGLKLADYEMEFRIAVVGLDEDAISELVGASRPN
jgi:hypothetical protein